MRSSGRNPGNPPTNTKNPVGAMEQVSLSPLDAMKPRQGWGTLGCSKTDGRKTRVGHPPAAVIGDIDHRGDFPKCPNKILIPDEIKRLIKPCQQCFRLY